eukprot:m.74788 g.74788  ORF g.74788 m.74788 type:complete len:425 (-) comp12480_c0_seq1:6160-7434(-)
MKRVGGSSSQPSNSGPNMEDSEMDDTAEDTGVVNNMQIEESMRENISNNNQAEQQQNNMACNAQQNNMAMEVGSNMQDACGHATVENVNNMFALQNNSGGNECNELAERGANANNDIPDEVGAYSIKQKELLGRGAFSVVYKGVHKNSGTEVAVKAITILNDKTSDFQLELKANQVIRGHPNVVTFLESVQPVRNMGYMMFELCERGEVFEQVKPGVGLVPRENIGSYFAQLVEALVHVHAKGICHLDVKPENLFVDRNGVVKLGDFGLCTFSEDGPVVSCHGSLCYAAPENVKCGLRKGQDAYGCPPLVQGYDGRKADVWSAGVVLFVLLYGLTPWDVARDSSYEYRMYKLSAGYPNINPWMRIPTVIRSIFHHTLWPRPGRRWSTDALRAYLLRDLGWTPVPPKVLMPLMGSKPQCNRSADR